MKAVRSVTSKLVSTGALEAIPTVLWYDDQDPCVVALEFHSYNGTVSEWHVSRDVLATVAFSRKPAGEQNFILRPETFQGMPMALACMRALDVPDPQGHQHILFVNRDLQLFLYDTFDLVPLGDEDYSEQIDAALQQILA
jgi:hypothetical protein